jgi:hypothetical protein
MEVESWALSGEEVGVGLMLEMKRNEVTKLEAGVRMKWTDRARSLLYTSRDLTTT